MTNAVLGYTGFVGSNIRDQLQKRGEYFDCYNSKNISDIKGKYYTNIYCACVPGTKWLANINPRQDLNNILSITKTLSEVNCENFYLVSSQDCNSTLTSNEDYAETPPTVYGIHRLQFEWFVRYKFPFAKIMRIGCLFGKGLKKNLIFDLLNNNLQKPVGDITYQLYCVDNLLDDFKYMDDEHIMIMNRFSTPVWASEIADTLGVKVDWDFKRAKYTNTGKHLLNKESQLNLLERFGKEYDRNM